MEEHISHRPEQPHHHGRHEGHHALHHEAQHVKSTVHLHSDGAAEQHVAKHLPKLEITEHEKYKRRLTDDKSPDAERLHAARHLVKDGVRSVHFKDNDGKEHDYKLQMLKGDRVRVSEGDKVILQDAGEGKRVQQINSRKEVRNENSETTMRHYFQSHRPSGLRETSRGHYHYEAPSGGRAYGPSPVTEGRHWNGVKNTDGSVAISFRGCQVDTDGRGAWRHPEDRTRQSHTSLRLSDGRSLDTDKDNFFVLPPAVAKAYGIHKGDLGWLVQKDTGNAVPVVFGDSGPAGKMGEASVAALKALGYNVNGARGVSNDRFEIVFAPGSGDGTGDIASNPAAMQARLAQVGLTVGAS